MPYTEDRMTLPTSVYGTTKRMGEEFIQESGCKYLIFRTAWLYSEYGNNFVKTMMKLFETKDEINVVNDQIGTPTYAGNLALLIVAICERMTPIEGKDTIPLLENGIYHFTDEGVASWYDFAYEIRECWQHKVRGLCGINGVTTKEYASKTKRPYYSVLDKTKYKKDFKGLYTPKNWRYGVREVVEKLFK
jgi:dTDP-4-dehydrorhamnose reductase